MMAIDIVMILCTQFFTVPYVHSRIEPVRTWTDIDFILLSHATFTLICGLLHQTKNRFLSFFGSQTFSFENKQNVLRVWATDRVKSSKARVYPPNWGEGAKKIKSCSYCLFGVNIFLKFGSKIYPSKIPRIDLKVVRGIEMTHKYTAWRSFAPFKTK